MCFIKSENAEDFINDEEIKETIEFAELNKNNKDLINETIKKAEKIKGLSHKEALLLLLCELEEENLKIFKLAEKIKNLIYGKRIVLFAPLYISNFCVNGCSYCPYCFEKNKIKRVKLTQEEIKEQVKILSEMGHKRIALEAGEDNKNCSMEYVLNSIESIYSVKDENNEQAIRRINVNIAATTEENYKKLKLKNIGTYVLFQETYNKKSYEKFHPFGPKSNYEFHTTAIDRAIKAGLYDVGLGILLGLENYKYDFTGLLMHKEHLEANFKIGPHTISVPRIKPANEIDVNNFKNIVPDEIFLKIVACFRIAAPYTGIIMSTRENEKIRKRSLEVGVSQISAGSSTGVGGYSKKEKFKNSEQFETSDKRSLNEVIKWLLKLGHIPSFCTACYRKNRIGESFMEFSKSGEIKKFCTPNALLTLQEFLQNFADNETKKLGENLILKEFENLKETKIKKNATKFLEEIKNKEKQDLFF